MSTILEFLKPKKTRIANKTANPYLNAKRTWNHHNQSLMSALRLWQTVGLMGLLIGVGSVGGMVYIGSQSKFIPLVFQQDKLGNMVSVLHADKMPEAKSEDYRHVASDFIEQLRMVTVDVALQRKAVFQVYAYLLRDDPATKKVNEFFNGSESLNPFNRAQHEMVSIEMESVLQLSGDSWQVDWIETTRTRDGSLKTAPQHMRAIVNVYQGEPSGKTDTELLKNPHGIFVRDFNWSKQG